MFEGHVTEASGACKASNIASGFGALQLGSGNIESLLLTLSLASGIPAAVLVGCRKLLRLGKVSFRVGYGAAHASCARRRQDTILVDAEGALWWS